MPEEAVGSEDPDAANGYERVAEQYQRVRNLAIGPEVMRTWCAELPAHAAVLELGCGFGLPISQVLVEAGVSLWVVDASPSLLRAFSARFPQVPAECARAEECRSLDRSFDGIVAWGLLFLLAVEDQRRLLARIAAAVRPGGRFVFTAPRERVQWRDVMTGLESRSLGIEEYAAILSAGGLVMTEHSEDAGGNAYYEARRPMTEPAMRRERPIGK